MPGAINANIGAPAFGTALSVVAYTADSGEQYAVSVPSYLLSWGVCDLPFAIGNPDPMPWNMVARHFAMKTTFFADQEYVKVPCTTHNANYDGGPGHQLTAGGFDWQVRACNGERQI